MKERGDRKREEGQTRERLRIGKRQDRDTITCNNCVCNCCRGDADSGITKDAIIVRYNSLRINSWYSCVHTPQLGMVLIAIVRSLNHSNG